MRTRAVILLVAGALLTGGCVVAPPWGDPGWTVGRPEPERIEALANTLVALAPDPVAARAEAILIARTAIQRTGELRERYRPFGPGPLNNVLVNAGWRERGLCYQWANDLLESLEALPLQHYFVYWGNAYWDSRLLEHNVPIVAARDGAWQDGVLLDAWRRGGRLMWMRVRDDRQYQWRLLTGDELVRWRPWARQPANLAQ